MSSRETALVVSNQGTSTQVTDNLITNNQINGNVGLGHQTNITIQRPNFNALSEVVSRSKELTTSDPAYVDILEALSDFLAQRPGRKVIGLEQKLINGDRTDLLEDAAFLENQASRRLARNQMSPTLQTLYLHCLAQINTAFCSHIQPLIQSGESKGTVDAATYQLVIQPICEVFSQVDPSFTTEAIRGFLFFLTGKCHIQWE
ncbi:MAG: hypothetical protein EKK46_11030 [Rhodocyclaceae bacterium]|nr:MAG: hypothetical protein EKK46_11030 [Rhodocyclaceae bacterium]